MAGPRSGTGREPGTARRRLPAAYWVLWSASSTSNLADGVRAAALPLLAVALTRDPRLVAGLTAVRTLPWLVFGLVAGAVVDRVDRRRLMILANLGQAALLGSLAVAVGTGNAGILALYVVAFVVGVGETLHDNAAQTVLPAVVHRDQLPDANGKLVAAERVTNEFAGPPLGAALFSVGAAVPVAADAVLAAASSALMLPVPGSFKVERDEAEPASLRRQIGYSLRWLWRHRPLRTLAGLAAVVGIVDTAWFATLVLFALDELGASQAQFGLLLAAGAIGSVAGALAAPRLSRAVGPARGIIGTLVAAGVVQLLLGLTGGPVLAGVLLAASGFALTAWNVLVVSLRQALVPAELLGRVTAAYRFVGLGSMPLGAVLGGILGQTLGLRAPLLLGAPVLVLAALLATRSVNRSTLSPVGPQPGGVDARPEDP
ncbi:MAG TPA: MFS transporter [Mycobacteriales bacterium]|nr:MFS transporter [Mycobacteriales bacterium]